MGAGLAARGERLGGPTAREVDVRTPRQHSDCSFLPGGLRDWFRARSARENQRVVEKMLDVRSLVTTRRACGKVSSLSLMTRYCVRGVR